MDKIRVLALFGQSGAGKDTIKDILLDRYPDQFHRIISCTTRPPRGYEQNMKEYHFLTEEEFAGYAYEEQFIEATEFNGWFYGTLLGDLSSEKINIAVLSPEGVEALLSTADIYNLQILPIYILAPDKTRILRALNREEEPNISEIFRRYETDIEDFHYISYFYFPVYNDREPMDSNEIVSTILKHCEGFFD